MTEKTNYASQMVEIPLRSLPYPAFFSLCVFDGEGKLCTDYIKGRELVEEESMEDFIGDSNLEDTIDKISKIDENVTVRMPKRIYDLVGRLEMRVKKDADGDLELDGFEIRDDAHFYEMLNAMVEFTTVHIPYVFDDYIGDRLMNVDPMFEIDPCTGKYKYLHLMEDMLNDEIYFADEGSWHDERKLWGPYKYNCLGVTIGAELKEAIRQGEQGFGAGLTMVKMHMVNIAAFMGNIELVKLAARCKRFKGPHALTLNIALSCGHLDIVEALHEMGCEHDNYVWSCAAEANNEGYFGFLVCHKDRYTKRPEGLFEDNYEPIMYPEDEGFGDDDREYCEPYGYLLHEDLCHKEKTYCLAVGLLKKLDEDKDGDDKFCLECDADTFDDAICTAELNLLELLWKKLSEEDREKIKNDRKDVLGIFLRAHTADNPDGIKFILKNGLHVKDEHIFLLSQRPKCFKALMDNEFAVSVYGTLYSTSFAKENICKIYKKAMYAIRTVCMANDLIREVYSGKTDDEIAEIVSSEVDVEKQRVVASLRENDPDKWYLL